MSGPGNKKQPVEYGEDEEYPNRGPKDGDSLYAYGGSAQGGINRRGQLSEPDRDRRMRGKENDMQLKFGSSKKDGNEGDGMGTGQDPSGKQGDDPTGGPNDDDPSGESFWMMHSKAIEEERSQRQRPRE